MIVGKFQVQVGGVLDVHEAKVRPEIICGGR